MFAASNANNVVRNLLCMISLLIRVIDRKENMQRPYALQTGRFTDSVYSALDPSHRSCYSRWRKAGCEFRPQLKGLMGSRQSHCN
jgi:hypothetical protein